MKKHNDIEGLAAEAYRCLGKKNRGALHRVYKLHNALAGTPEEEKHMPVDILITNLLYLAGIPDYRDEIGV
jgi:hypothetical protein